MDDGAIHPVRYKNYLKLLNEAKEWENTRRLRAAPSFTKEGKDKG